MQFLKTALDLFCEITALISAFQRYIDTLRELKDKSMYVNGIQCDNCNKMHNMNILKQELPQEWFVLAKSGSDDKKHFCCIECLIEWTSLQTIDSRKFDTGGPIVALSGEEYERRFGKEGSK